MKKLNVLSVSRTVYLRHPIDLWQAISQLHTYFIIPTKLLIAYITFRGVVVFNFNEIYFDHLYITEKL